MPWAEFISRTGVSPNAAYLRWGDADASVTLQFNYDDVATQPLLQSVVSEVLGYAVRVPTGVNLNQNVITGASNTAPIVLTTSAWTVQPSPGQTLVVSGINGNTAANGTWVVGASDATTVTLLGTEGNGTFGASPNSSVQAEGAISRVLPIRHPIWPQLWCTSIAKTTFYGPNGKSISQVGFGPTEKWRIAQMELHFQSLDYALLTDAQLNAAYGGNEFYRYVSGPYIDYNLVGLQRQPGVGGGFTWGADAPPSLVGKSVQQGATQYLPTYDLLYTWQLVPQDSLLNDNSYAVNINYCFGSVNSKPWMDYLPGTLLCHKPSVVPAPAPFPLNASFLTQPQRLWVAKIRLSYNPTGWNRIPTPAGGYASIQLPDGSNLYPSIDFNEYLFVSL
jgi:hypothetical protein